MTYPIKLREQSQSWGATQARKINIDAFFRFLKDESGQGTAEYALILLIVLMMANTFKSQFKRALTGLLGKLEQQMTEAGED